MTNKMTMHWTEAEELAVAVLGMDESVAESDAVEQALADKFGISVEQFQQVAEALMPFTIPAQAALSGEISHGFVKDGAFIVKAPAVSNDPSGQARKEPPPIGDEMAAEIERLRAAVAKLQEPVEDLEAWRLRFPGAVAAVEAAANERCASYAEEAGFRDLAIDLRMMVLRWD